MLELKKSKSFNEKINNFKGLNLNIKPGEVHAIMGPKRIWKKYFSKCFIWKKWI